MEYRSSLVQIQKSIWLFVSQHFSYGVTQIVFFFITCILIQFQPKYIYNQKILDINDILYLLQVCLL